MTDKFTAILEQEEQLLKASVVKAMAEMNKSATQANIRNYQAAKKALDDFLDKKGGVEKFKTQASALEYLQRNWKIEKSKLNKDVISGRCPRKDGYFLSSDLDYYASASVLPPKTTEKQPDSGVDRLKLAMAEEREFRVGILKGEYINAAEEEARDARLWAAVKTDLENHAPAIVNELINRVIILVDDEHNRERIQRMAHELRMTYEDAIGDIFDRYARDGGIEA